MKMTKLKAIMNQSIMIMIIRKSSMTKINSLLYPMKKHKRKTHSLKAHNRKKLKLWTTHRRMTLKKKKQK